jgi:hypothetical protein
VDSSGSEQYSVVGSDKHDDETLVSINSGGSLSDCQILRNGSPPWS